MPQQTTRLPDFILIGAQKSGTTMLMKALRKHPAVHIAGRPPHWTEMHFFDNGQNWSRGVAWYQSHFDRPHLLQGEKTPEYLSSPVAIERMAQTVPDAKLVVLLRNPVERAYSQWNHYNQEAERFAPLGWEVLPFEEAVERSRLQPESIFGQLLGKGVYVRQLAKVLEHFERDQLYIGIAERWRRAPGEEYERLLRFLGLESVDGEPEHEHVREYQSPMDAATYAMLERHFAHHNAQLFELIGEEIPEWRKRSQRTDQVFIERDLPFGTGYDICFVTTCMGRLEHLKQSLSRMLSQRNACALVVDYSCPDRAGDWVEKTFDSKQARVVRVEGQSEYNRAGARNAGALVPASAWIAMVDADTLLPAHFLDAQLPEFCDGRYYVLVEEPQHWSALSSGVRDLYGFVIARPWDVRRVGGYDEVLQGWGAEDVDLRARLRDAGLEEVRLFGKMPESIAHADAERTRYHQFGSKRVSNTINLLYSRVKRDVVGVGGKQLSLREREAIYGSVCDAFSRAVASGNTVSVDLSLPAIGVESGFGLARKLSYQFRLPPGMFHASELPDPSRSGEP